MEQSQDRLDEGDMSLHPMFLIAANGIWIVLDIWTPATAKVTCNLLLVVWRHFHVRRQLPISWPTTMISLGLDVAGSFALWLFVPIQHQLAAQQAFYQSVLPFLADGFASWRRDSPSTPSTDNRARQHHHRGLQIVSLMLLKNPTWWMLFCMRVIICVVVPLFCIVVVLYPLEAYKLLDPIFPKFLRKAYQIWDVCQTLPPWLLEGLPNVLQVKVSQLQQKRAIRRSLPIHQYAALRTGEIRLLVLKRAVWPVPGTIEATLVHVPGDSTGEFEAVSYCWGGCDRTEEILLDGARYSITRSALDLLIARRSFWNDRTIWIDAICINQDDNTEKSTQLGYMRDIYYLASRVVAFPGADFRFRLIEPLLRCSLTDTTLHFRRRAGSLLFEGPQSLPLQVRILGHFLSSDYFNRAWVFQEVTVGQTVHVYLGGRFVAWETLATALANMTPSNVQLLFTTAGYAATAEMNQGLFLSDSRTLVHVKLIHDCRVMAQHLPSLGTSSGGGVFAAINAEKNWEMGNFLAEDLELAVFYTNQFKASDARDRLFSLLGVVQHQSRNSLLRPDYEKPAGQVFRDLAMYLLFHTRTPSVNILALAGNGFTKSRNVVESWVPDLGEERPCLRLTYTRTSGYKFETMVDRDASIAIGSLPGSISVTGLVIDKVACLSSAGPLRISHTYQAGNLPQKNESIFAEMHEFIVNAICLVDQYKTQWPALHEQLWRTLIAGGNKSTERFDEILPHILEHVIVCLNALRSEGTFRGFMRALSSQGGIKREGVQDSELVRCISLYIESMAHVCAGRCLGITKGGRLCLLPPLTEAGSTVFVAFGAQLPFVLHQRPTFSWQEVYELVGEAYVEGTVRGELQALRIEQTTVHIQ